MKNSFVMFTFTLMLSLIAFSSADIQAQASDSTYKWTLPRWRVEMIAEDLIRYDSLLSELLKAQKDVQTWQSVAAARTRMNRHYRSIIKERDIRIALLREDLRLSGEKEIILQTEGKKYKRQRNRVIAGVVIVAVIKNGLLAYRELKR
jgi:hypothetical protein